MKRVIGLFAAMLILLCRLGRSGREAAIIRVEAGILRLQRADPNRIMARHNRVHPSRARHSGAHQSMAHTRSTRSRTGVSEMLRGTPRLRTFMTTAAGSDMIWDETIRITIWIARMSMGVSPSSLDRRTSGVWAEAVRIASSSTASIVA